MEATVSPNPCAFCVKDCLHVSAWVAPAIERSGVYPAFLGV